MNAPELKVATLSQEGRARLSNQQSWLERTMSQLSNSGPSTSLENCDTLMISRSQKRTRDFDGCRNFQVWNAQFQIVLAQLRETVGVFKPCRNSKCFTIHNQRTYISSKDAFCGFCCEECAEDYEWLIHGRKRKRMFWLDGPMLE